MANSTKNTYTLAEVKSVAKKLKDGETKLIADRTSFSHSHVSNVMAGRRMNFNIYATAKKLTARRK